MDASRRTRAAYAALVVTLLMATGLLVRVAQGKQAAEGQYNELYDRVTNPHPGIYVPIFDGTSNAGTSVRIGDVAPGRRQVLLFFTTSCPYCRASVPTWKALADEVTRRADSEVFGVAIDSAQLVASYVQEHDLTHPIVLMNNRRFARLFRVNGIPLTMVLNPGGQVAFARKGEFSNRRLMDSVLAVLDSPIPEPLDAPLQVPSVSPNTPPAAQDER